MVQPSVGDWISLAFKLMADPKERIDLATLCRTLPMPWGQVPAAGSPPLGVSKIIEDFDKTHHSINQEHRVVAGRTTSATAAGTIGNGPGAGGAAAAASSSSDAGGEEGKTMQQ